MLTLSTHAMLTVSINSCHADPIMLPQACALASVVPCNVCRTEEDSSTKHPASSSSITFASGDSVIDTGTAGGGLEDTLPRGANNFATIEGVDIARGTCSTDFSSGAMVSSKASRGSKSLSAVGYNPARVCYILYSDV